MTTAIIIALMLFFFFIAMVLRRKELIKINIILASIATVYFILNALRSDQIWQSVAWLLLALVVLGRGIMMLRKKQTQQLEI